MRRHAVSSAFYDAVLEPLGASRLMDFGVAIGYGVPPEPDFWIGEFNSGDGFRESHIAFKAADRAAVRAFFDAAVTAGAEVLHEPRVARVPRRLLRRVRARPRRQQCRGRLPQARADLSLPSDLVVGRVLGGCSFRPPQISSPERIWPAANRGRVRGRRGRRRSWVLGRSRGRARCGRRCRTRRRRRPPWRTDRPACRRRASLRSRRRNRCGTPTR